ncbi:MAG: hypothetical protein QM500_15740 [Methylococcales bacterium]
MKKILIKISKFIGIILAVSIVGAMSFGVYIYIHEELPKKKINITVLYSPNDACSKEFPMEVLIFNDSSRVLEETKFDIDVKRKGYSKKISTSRYLHYYETDKIIEPGNTYIACWTYPTIEKEHKNKYTKEELIYTIGYKSLYFEN